MKRRNLALLAAAATFALSAPAYGQMDHSNMPGMTMPMPAKKPAPANKKAVPKKAPAKKAATKPAAAKKAVPSKTGAAKQQAAKPAANKRAAAPQAAQTTTTPAAPAAQSPSSMPGHDMSTMPGMTMPSAPAPQPATPACLPEHAAMGHCTPTPAPKPQAAPKPAGPPAAQTCLPEHAAMGHCTPAPATQAPARVAEGTDLPAGNAPPPPVPVANAADAYFDPRAMEMGRHHLQEFHGGQKLFQVLNNIMEYHARGGRDGYEWDSEGWYGGDIDRFWFKTEGDGTFGGPLETAEVQALYSRAIDPYFNVQAGIRYDFKPNPSRAYATLGVEGLAPSFFDVEGALFFSNKGEVMARASGSYDQRITQRLILQPRAEVDFAAQNSREIGVGAGLSKGEIGIRLRYDIRREFAPYIGVQYQRAFGRTARYLRGEGEDVGGFQFLAGVRTWF